MLDEVERLASSGCWAFGYVAYEAASGLDAALVTASPVDGLPLAWFGVSARCERTAVVRPRRSRGRPVRSWSPDWDGPTHEAAVRAVQERIAAGETYQCNLTTRLRGVAPTHPLRLYHDLALSQRGAYNAYLDTGRFVVVSASPELFFRVHDGRILMRPMKGTAARGRTTSEDAAARDRLRSSAKERAENIMIVDLVRNDLARLAEPGTVTVPRLLRTERYETVYQLTSDVTAQLSPDVGLCAIFQALFPCGSVTGAPKVRTMELIEELETSPRGVYCGAIGVVGPPVNGRPRARFSVGIRTVAIDRDAGTATYGTGGGITWDSVPSAEYAELLTKARVLESRPRTPSG